MTPRILPLDTRRAAYESAPIQTVQDLVLALLEDYPEGLTVHEAARVSGWSTYSIAPCISKLHKEGVVRDTGLRHLNPSGKAAAVWALADTMSGVTHV